MLCAALSVATAHALAALCIRFFSGEQGPPRRTLALLFACFSAAWAIPLLPLPPVPAEALAALAVALLILLATLTYESVVRIAPPAAGTLDGRLIVVTGASAGIGEAAAAQFLGRGATVVFACRSRARAEAAMSRAQRESGAAASRSIYMQLDLSDPASVRAFATAFLARWNACDALVCNAGLLSPTREECAGVGADGARWERHLGANHLGHFLLIQLLLPAIRFAHGRVIRIFHRCREP